MKKRTELARDSHRENDEACSKTWLFDNLIGMGRTRSVILRRAAQPRLEGARPPSRAVILRGSRSLSSGRAFARTRWLAPQDDGLGVWEDFGKFFKIAAVRISNE